MFKTWRHYNDFLKEEPNKESEASESPFIPILAPEIVVLNF